MMNLEAFYSDIETINFTGTAVGILETPFLECYDFPELSSILEMYYSGNFSQAFEITNALIKMVPSDACIYNLAGSTLFQQGQHMKAHDFFKNACQIIYSYHAVYHFIGYVLYYNRATLHHILGNAEAKKKDLSKAQFLYHQNNPNRDIPIEIHDENLHFKNPVKDMLPREKTLTHLSIFKESNLDKSFWKSLTFFEKRQWEKALNACNSLVETMDSIHLEYHYYSACIFYNRGMNCLALNKPDIAISDFSKAIAFDVRNPNNKLYKQALQKAQKMLEGGGF
jgi:tetratricopeptide (TPR) repeat protein